MIAKVSYSSPCHPDMDYEVSYKCKTVVSVFSKIKSEVLFRERIGCQITNFSVCYGEN